MSFKIETQIEGITHYLILSRNETTEMFSASLENTTAPTLFDTEILAKNAIQIYELDNPDNGLDFFIETT